MRAVAWKHGVVSVDALGGMIGPTVFLLPNGRPVSPFHVAPWWNEEGGEHWDGLTKGLRGEWPCVPFGFPLPGDDYPESWAGEIEGDATVDHVHGFGSNHNWTFDDKDDEQISLFIEYPKNQAVKRLERVIRPRPDAPVLDISLTVFVRRASCEPIALHGCFRLPNLVRDARLEPGAFEIGQTHPSTVEPDAPLFGQDMRFSSLTDVPSRNGGIIDASYLPLDRDGEDLLQLNQIDGNCRLFVRDEGYVMSFSWDSSVLPSLLLWYSNHGRSAKPWENRNTCIGIEPTCSAFGLSPEMSRSHNPIAQSGTPTCIPLDPDKPLTINYQIGVGSL